MIPRRITISHVAREPFRMFFPAAVLAGIIGVALWPLHFWGMVEWYPGQIHARMMAYGLFGGFIIGFLGTAMPRMLSARSLRFVEVASLGLVYAAMVVSLSLGRALPADSSMALLLVLLVSFMGVRARQRKDTPPPGFVLVGFALICAFAGALLAIWQDVAEPDVFWINLHHLLAYQGFVLLPILGIGPFILPRFFGLQSAHDFEEALIPGPGWTRKAALGAGTGIVIVASFIVEAAAWYRSAYAIRFFAVLAYVLIEMPFHRAPKAGSALGISIRIAFLCVVAGFFAIAIFPHQRVGLLHLTLIGGFALITFVVATRVVFGHSGNIELLKRSNRWLYISAGLMLFGMSTRISGDFWPRIMASHYIYGAITWILGVSLWALFVLPKVLVVEDEN